MAGTPEEDLLAWLEREEENLGFDLVQEALGDLERARQLFYEELGYDMTDDQFNALSGASTLRYEEMPAVGIDYGRIEQTWGFQPVYRDLMTGRFVSKQDAFSLLATARETK